VWGTTLMRRWKIDDGGMHTAGVSKVSRRQPPVGRAQSSLEEAESCRAKHNYNLSNTGAWAQFTGAVGDCSNFGTAQANVQMSIRAEF